METRTIVRTAGTRSVIPMKDKIESAKVSRRVPSGKNGKHQERPQQIEVQVEFKIESTHAKEVWVAGSFNGWEMKRTPLKRSGTEWKTSISLPRGRYEYRFVVDGQWMADPSAQESAPNPFGGRNSVLSL